jgi:hypothetical protein
MIPIKRYAMKRRTFLRGVLRGSPIVLGLPLLDAMLDGSKEARAQALSTRRFVSFFFGNGVNLNKFEPDQPGTNTWALPELLNGLGDLKSYLTVCTGLQNRFSGSILTHHEGMTAFSGYDFIPRPDLVGFASDWGGPTVDQVIADRIAASSDPTPFHSLQIQVSKQLSPADTGGTATYLSVRGEPGALVPKPAITSPRDLFQLVFGAPPAPDGVRTSILDFLKYDLGQMRRRLGAGDNLRMEAHLDGIRALEIQAEVAGLACTVPTQPTEENLLGNGDEPLTLVNTLMSELIATCFECDITRVASVLFVGLAAESTLGDVGPTTGKTHHMWSHARTANGTNGVNGYEQNINYIMNRYGDWMRALRNRVEPDGVTNLLDTTILYASSDCANGNHKISRQPILLGGHGRGHLKSPGIHFQARAPDAGDLNATAQPADGNMSDVLLTCLRAFDPAAASVGDLGTGTGSSTSQSEIEAP